MSKERAARAGIWSALDLALRQGVQFGVTIVLARLLAPADFGLIALLTFFTSLSITFVQGGLSLALVQRLDTSREEESAVFWVNLAASLVFATLIVLIAPAAARFYGQPTLHWLMFVAAGQVVLSALGAVHTELLTRTLQFHQIAKTGLVSSLLSAAAAVTAAAMGLGVWALAIQLLVQAGAGTAALWWVSPWRPQLRFRLSSIRHLYGFGAFISLSSVLEVLYSNGFSLVLGKLYGLADLGILNRAVAIQALPTGIISQVVSRTALPLFSARADDKPALLRGFSMTIRVSMLLSLPLITGLALLADLVVPVLYGDKWMRAVYLLRLLAFGGSLLPFHVLNLQLLLAQGESRTFFSLEIQKKVLGIICYGIGCCFGILGIAYASIVFGVLAFLVNAEPTRKSLGYGVVRQLLEIRDIVAATLFMAAGVYLLRQLLDLAPAIELAVLVGAGGLLYAGFGLALRLPSFREAWGLVTAAGGRFGRRAPAPAHPSHDLVAYQPLVDNPAVDDTPSTAPRQ